MTYQLLDAKPAQEQEPTNARSEDDDPPSVLGDLISSVAPRGNSLVRRCMSLELVTDSLAHDVDGANCSAIATVRRALAFHVRYIIVLPSATHRAISR